MKFLVVDDDWLTRGGVVKALEALRPGAIVVEASSLDDAYSALQHATETDLVILDLNLTSTRGIDTLKQFRSWCDAREIEPRTVVLSGANNDNPKLVVEVLARHATGFIVKGTKARVFEHALSLTLEGGVFIPEEILRTIAPNPTDEASVSASQPLNLTPREREVAALLIQGRTYKGIASELCRRHKQTISDKTVRTHVGNIAWKLGVSENAKAGVMAEIARRGLKFDLSS